VSVRGSAATLGLINLLDLIHGNGHAGTLRLQIGGRTTKLHFYQGQIFLPLSGSRGGARLGALLVRAGKLNGRDLLRALQVQKREKRRDRLGDVLVRLGLVSRDDLNTVIRAQFEEEICDLLFEEGAYFEFKKDVLPAGFADSRGKIQALGFDTRSILMEASRRLDEWNRIHAAIPSTRAIYRLAVLPSGAWHVDTQGSLSASSSSSEGPLMTDAEERVRERWGSVDALFEENPFDGTRTVDEVAQASGVSAFVAMGLIAELKHDGLIRALTASEVEQNALRAVKAGRPALAYKLHEWANEAEQLRATASALDKVLLRSEHLSGHTFTCRTTSERAIQVLSRLLRRGAPFRYLAREGESLVEVYFTPGSLRLHLLGPRRTHSTTRYLRRRRAISSKGLDRARRTAKGEDRKLDRVLLEDGYVERSTWIRAVKDKVVSGMFSVFGWREPLIEVEGGVVAPPPPEEVTEGLVCEIPLNEGLHDSLRRDLLRWKVLLKEIPSPDVVFTCAQPTPRGQPRRAHDLFDERRTVGDLIQLARVAPLELVRFVYDCLRSKRIRRLSEKEHYDALEAARAAELYDDAIVYCKSAIAFGYATQLYRQRLGELRSHLEQGAQRAESRQVLEGHVSSLGLGEVVQLLHQERRSGTLKVTEGEREKVFYIDQGDLHVLKVEDSAAEQEVWDLLIGDETRSSLNLGDLLQRKGSVDESELGADELDRLRDDIFDTFLWEDATYEFVQNLLPPEIRQESDRATKVSLRMDKLLMGVMGVLSEWDQLRRRLKSQDAVFRYSSPPAQLEAIQSRLGPAGYLFDGKHTLGDVVRISGDCRLQIYRAVNELLGQGVLVFVGVKRKSSKKASEKRRALASGRIPRLREGSAEQKRPRTETKARRKKPRRPRPALESDDDIDVADLGDSFAEESIEDVMG